MAIALFALFAAPTRAGQQSTPAMREDAQLRDLFFLDPDLGWAVGDRGVIWHTADGGRTWRLQASGVDCALRSVWFSDPDNGLAVGGESVVHSHLSRGVILRTQDGGRHWRSEQNLLPALRLVRFGDKEHGWALGESSGLFPSGVFTTENAGKTWRPLPGAMASGWAAGDLMDPLTGALAGPRGAIAALRRGALQPARTPSFGLRGLMQMRLNAQGGGWLVGEGGLVLTTVDLGMSWQLPPAPIPDPLRDHFDFLALSVVGQNGWIAGSPGSLVLHTPDAGRTWNVFPTGQTLPLRAVRFIDPMRGWAVGDLGTILATSDGGKSWRRQHGGGTRAAVLGVFGDAATLPWEMFAQLSANDGYLAAVEIVGRRDVEPGPAARATEADRLHDAAAAVGVSGTNVAWQFPLKQEGLTARGEEIVAAWNHVHDGRGLERLEEHLVRQIRTWRPEVIVTHAATASARDPLANVVNQVVLKAVSSAADPTSFPQQHVHAGLAPWQVKKVVSWLPPGDHGPMSLTTATLAPRLGRSLAELADEPRGLVSAGIDGNERLASPTTVDFRVSKSVLPEQVSRQDLMSGIRLHPGGEARRLLDEPPGGLEAQKRSAQKYHNVQAILDRAKKSDAEQAKLLGQMGDLTRDLGETTAPRVLFALAGQCHRQGRGEMAAEIYELLVDKYPNHPLATPSLIWLVQYWSSGELAWRAKRAQSSTVTQAGAVAAGQEDDDGNAGVVSSVRGQQAIALVTGTSDVDRPAHATELGKRLERAWPAVFAEPSVRFPLAAAYVAGGLPREAEKFYLATRTGRPRDAWWSCAAAEHWLVERQGQPPKNVFRCGTGPIKPYLDGRVDEPIWNAAEKLELRAAAGDDAALRAVAMLARDDEFLYVAVQCRKAPGVEYQKSDVARTRDADLLDNDRVDLFIDIDRDYATWFRFTMDHRGWTADACWTDPAWDPTWFVAARDEADTWTVEAAIPLTELTSRPPSGKVAWAVGIQRTIPGAGFQSWTLPASTAVQPEGFGLMVFE
ncbi:MAG: hypothetical protein HYS13_19965 [Planctomycetia bacterium]|nr:hypothetical protein [Planctomycetia bacterium]